MYREVILPGETAVDSEVDWVGQDDAESTNQNHNVCHLIVKKIVNTEIQLIVN